MNAPNCPICEQKIELLNKVKYLERFVCPTCQALLEVVNLEPLELDWIYYDENLESNGRERSNNQNNAKCPLCRENVHISPKFKVGDRVICTGCDAQLEIVSLVPLELDWPYDSYDYNYQDDDYYEESLDSYDD